MEMRTMSTLDQINLFNLRYTNISPVANCYAQTSKNLTNTMAKPRKSQYRTVNQLLKESPLVGSTKLGLNFIA